MSVLTSQTPGLQVDVLDDVASWDALEMEWGELFEASPTASPPLRWEWLRQWWRIYGPVYGGRGLRIVTVRRGGHLIGALPLYLHIGHRSPVWTHYLGFLSTGESRSEETGPEYLDLLHAPGEARACLDAILPALLDPAVGRWDILELCGIGGGSPLLAWRDQAPRDVRVVVIPHGACPVADLSGGFEAYLGRLSASGRKQARRMLRAVESTGIRFEVASTPSDAAQFFDQLVRLHQARWNSSGRPGCFSAHRFTEFHRTLAEPLGAHRQGNTRSAGPRRGAPGGALRIHQRDEIRSIPVGVGPERRPPGGGPQEPRDRRPLGADEVPGGPRHQGPRLPPWVIGI